MQRLSVTTNGAAASADRCAAALLDALPAVMWFIRRDMRQRRAAGLSVPQFRVLAHLRRCPAASLYTVAEKLGSSLPTISRIVSGLVAHGLVSRQECAADRRRLSLCLTKRGEAVLETAWSGTQAAVAEKLAQLPEADRETLARALLVLNEVFTCSERCAHAGETASTAAAS